MGKPSGKSCFPLPRAFRARPDFPGHREGARRRHAVQEKLNFNRKKKENIQLHLPIRRNAKQLTLTSDDGQGGDLLSALSCCSSCEIPADETPEEEKPSSFLSLLPNYSVDQEVPLVQGGVNTNRHLHSFVCSCRCASSLCIRAQTCLPNRP